MYYTAMQQADWANNCVGARDVIYIIEGNGRIGPSSKPRRKCLHIK